MSAKSDLVLVKNFPNRLLAEQAKLALDSKGIPSFIQTSDTGIIGLVSLSLLSGVDLYVSSEHAQEAARILNFVFDGI